MMDNLSPEVAAQIVKHYILPMFESDGRKLLKQKYNKMAGISNATGKKFKTGQTPVKAGIYDELKLSEQLSHELNSIKIKLDEYKEILEEAIQERDSMRLELMHHKKLG